MSVFIQVHQVRGKLLTYEMKRNATVIDLLNRLSEDTTIHPSRIRLIDHGKVVTRFAASLNNYIPAEATWKHFHITERRKHSTIEYDLPDLYQKAIDEVGSDSNQLDCRIKVLFEKAVSQAINSVIAPISG